MNTSIGTAESMSSKITFSSETERKEVCFCYQGKRSTLKGFKVKKPSPPLALTPTLPALPTPPLRARVDWSWLKLWYSFYVIDFRTWVERSSVTEIKGWRSEGTFLVFDHRLVLSLGHFFPFLFVFLPLSLLFSIFSGGRCLYSASLCFSDVIVARWRVRHSSLGKGRSGLGRFCSFYYLFYCFMVCLLDLGDCLLSNGG